MTLVRTMMSFALAAILCLGMAVPVFATGNNFSEGDEGNDATAAITKIFHMAEGTITPAEKFTFTFTAKSVDDITTNLAGRMPVITAQEIGFGAGDTAAAVDGMTSLPKEADDIFNGVNWPHAGEYVYTVKETKGANDNITYSKTEYDIHVYVANGTNGGLYVKAISAYRIKDEEGATIPQEKVDPTPGEDSDNPFSQLIFNNTYVKTSGGGDPGVVTNHALSVENAVTGTYGDKTKYFEYTLTIDRPATLDEELTYEAYVMAEVEGVLKVVTNSKNYANLKNHPVYGYYFEVKTGEPITFNLQHGQKLVFTEIHYGASYIATESADLGYKAKVDVVANGNALGTLANAEFGKARSTAPDDDPTFKHAIGENANTAIFTNDYKTVTPTGVSVDTLPYTLIIIVAAIALAGYATFRYRRSSKSER